MAGNRGQKSLDAWLSSGSRTDTPQNRTPRASTNSRERRTDSRREALRAVAAETQKVLPTILQSLPHIQASHADAFYLETLSPCDVSHRPTRASSSHKISIRVINEDSFNAGISLASSKIPGSSRVAVLNMASHSSPGGGWLRGAFAQEEMLCYRSSLSLSLHRRYYPWKQRMGIYTPDVVILRSDMPSGHTLLVPELSPNELPVVSVLSIAALRQPPVRNIYQTAAGVGTGKQKKVFANSADRNLTKDKMRLCLRMATHRGHTSLVLGALGCGAFQNPPGEVAACWLEVLQEDEFQGGWWDDIVFAVYDTKNEGNFAVFHEILDGVEL